MKKSRLSDNQILAIFKQAQAGTPVTELCREHGMSAASFYQCSEPPQVKALYGRHRSSSVCPSQSFSTHHCICEVAASRSALRPFHHVVSARIHPPRHHPDRRLSTSNAAPLGYSRILHR